MINHVRLIEQKKPVICVEKQRLNNTETDDFSLCGDETEVIGTAILNKGFYEILLLSCNHIDKSIEIIDDNCNTSSVVTSTSDKPEDAIQCSSTTNIYSQLCVDRDIVFYSKLLCLQFIHHSTKSV